MPLGVNNLDGEQLRQAARLVRRENERLLRQVLELKQRLASAEGKGSEQLELLAEFERQLAARNRKLFGDSGEQRGSTKPTKEKPSQPGHARELLDLRSSSAGGILAEADHVRPSRGDR